MSLSSRASGPGRRRLHAASAAAVTAAVVLGTITATATPAAAADRQQAPVVTAAPSSDPGYDTDLKLDPALLSGDRTFTAFVRTSGLGALSVDAAAKGGRVVEGRPRSAAATQRVSAITATTRAITAQARSLEPRARAIYSTSYTVPGVAIVATAKTFRALAARRDVVSIVPVVTKRIVDPAPTSHGTEPANAFSDVFTQAVKTWTQTGHTGAGINVAVIDTGIDYTHADFGGPGTRAAWLQAGSSPDAPTADEYDGAKYLGGYDFAGISYNADDSSPAYQPYPEPDADPIDGPGGGHGTHVAGSIAGFGVTADGKTFTGDPRTLTEDQVKQMKIGPGTAPGAGLYALKVFGDYGGSTNLTGAALDWVGEALTRGVQINVMNLSLGSNYGVADDPDNAKIDALVQQGVVPVIAQGNAGDLTDVGGSPGNSAGALTVAASTNGHSKLDGVNVLAPSDVMTGRPYTGQYSVNYLFDQAAVQGDVATLTETGNVTGCGAFSAADAARVKGKIAWLEWDDADVKCGSAARFDNAEAAGAIGVVLAGTVNAFQAGIAGNYTIPGMELTKDSVTALRPAAEAGTLRLEFRDDLHGVFDVDNPADADTIADFSSRGEHGAYDDVVKPDVSAPGVNIVSAGVGQGTGSETLSGTSMATPLTAGIVALAFQAHPGWTAQEIKADVMNTAGHDVTQDGVVLDNLRQGAGRVDALAAVDNQVTLTSEQNGDLVTASFGVLEVAKATTATRTLVVTNRGSAPVTYQVAYRSRVTQPGVTFSLDRSTVTVPARGVARLTLTLSIPTPSALRRVINPTQAISQAGTGRDFVAAASGLVTLTPAGQAQPLRLPVFAAPKPVSTMATLPVTFASTSATTAPLRQQGGALQQGSGTAAYAGAVAPFVLGATSPAKSFPAGSPQQTLAGLDLLAVGAASTAPLQQNPANGMLAFGVRTRGPLSNPGAAGYPVVDIDVDRDGRWDFQTFVSKRSGSDVAVAVTIDSTVGAVVDIEPLNENRDGLYANVFDSSVVVLPVSLARLGYTAGTKLTTISYRVHTESAVAPTAAQGNFVVDATPTATFDVFRPALWFSGRGVAGRQIVLPDTASGITVHRRASSVAQVLALHLGNAASAQTNQVAVSSTPTLAVARVSISGSVRVGSRMVATASGWNTTGVTVRYQWLRDGRPISGATGAAYRTTSADVRRVIGVRVTGSKPGWNPVSRISGLVRIAG